jgi:hypothetical protein
MQVSHSGTPHDGADAPAPVTGGDGKSYGKRPKPPQPGKAMCRENINDTVTAATKVITQQIPTHRQQRQQPTRCG